MIHQRDILIICENLKMKLGVNINRSTRLFSIRSDQ